MKIIKVIFLILILTGCKKIKDNYTTFIIKENRHRSTTAYNTTKDTIFNWRIIFDSSAIYTSKDSANQYDINKLIGWSDCKENHMDYSIRFGWRWLNGNLEIHWFRHQHGLFSFGKIKNISLCEPHDYSLLIRDNEYTLCVDQNICSIKKRSCSSVMHQLQPEDCRKYMLYPYFGGQEKAPHRIKIKIKNI